MYSRRDFGKLAGAGLVAQAALAGKLDSKIDGVRLGVQTYSYRHMPRPDIISTVVKAMSATGLAECELFGPQVEPPPGAAGDGGPLDAGAKQQAAVEARNNLRKWRLEVPLDYFKNIRAKFDAAGINVYIYNLSFNSSFTDDEIDRIFEHAKALGVNIITVSTTLPVAKRVVPFAEKHKMYVSLHGHANVTDPNEFATPASFRAGLEMSKYFKVNLDIGHFTAANFDALAYIRENHANITNLHLKDRLKNGGPNVEWGKGETPIKPVLQLLKKSKYEIPAYIEYEYQGKGTDIEEVKKCFDYAKDALA